MKTIVYVLTIAGLSASAFCLNGQVAAPESRWVAGIGFGMNIDYFSQYSQGDEREILAVPVEGKVEFRLFRWLSLVAQSGYSHFHSSRAQFRTVSGSPHPFLLSYRAKHLTLSVAPQFQARIWQGDLSLAIHLGHYRQWFSQEARWHGRPGPIYTEYEPASNDFLGTRLGYTFWPRRRFGVALEFEAATSFGGAKGGGLLQARNTAPEGAPPGELAAREPLQVGGQSWETIWMGFRYRF